MCESSPGMPHGRRRRSPWPRICRPGARQGRQSQPLRRPGQPRSGGVCFWRQPSARRAQGRQTGRRISNADPGRKFWPRSREKHLLLCAASGPRSLFSCGVVPGMYRVHPPNYSSWGRSGGVHGRRPRGQFAAGSPPGDHGAALPGEGCSGGRVGGRGGPPEVLQDVKYDFATSGAADAFLGRFRCVFGAFRGLLAVVRTRF